MQIRASGGGQGCPGRGAGGTALPPALLWLSAGRGAGAGPKGIRGFPCGTQFRTGEKVRLTHLRNSVPKVAKTRCLGRISRENWVSALPFETQFRTGKKMMANHLVNSVRRVAKSRWLSGLCRTGTRQKQALGCVVQVSEARVSSSAAATPAGGSRIGLRMTACLSGPEGRLELLRVRTPALRATCGVIWAVGNTPPGGKPAGCPNRLPAGPGRPELVAGLWEGHNPAGGRVKPAPYGGTNWKSETCKMSLHQPRPPRSNRIKPNQTKSNLKKIMNYEGWDR